MRAICVNRDKRTLQAGHDRFPFSRCGASPHPFSARGRGSSIDGREPADYLALVDQVHHPSSAVCDLVVLLNVAAPEACPGPPAADLGLASRTIGRPVCQCLPQLRVRGDS
jgi:hypothetical protein